LNRKS